MLPRIPPNKKWNKKIYILGILCNANSENYLGCLAGYHHEVGFTILTKVYDLGKWWLINDTNLIRLIALYNLN